jgi:hypothetical protein
MCVLCGIDVRCERSRRCSCSQLGFSEEIHAGVRGGALSSVTKVRGTLHTSCLRYQPPPVPATTEHHPSTLYRTTAELRTGFRPALLDFFLRSACPWPCGYRTAPKRTVLYINIYYNAFALRPQRVPRVPRPRHRIDSGPGHGATPRQGPARPRAPRPRPTHTENPRPVFFVYNPRRSPNQRVTVLHPRR